jgi:hypothetical protein
MHRGLTETTTSSSEFIYASSTVVSSLVALAWASAMQEACVVATATLKRSGIFTGGVRAKAELGTRGSE